MSVIAVASKNSMIEVIPAVLPRSYEELVGKLAELRGVAKVVQIDVVDGVFAPSRTWPYGDETRFSRILAEEEGLPFWEDFSFELDLMVLRAREEAARWVTAGVSGIIIHAESEDAREAVHSLQEKRGEGPFSISVGIALSLQTPLEELEQFAGLYDFVQLMGIAQIGKQGEPFDERVYARAEELRRRYAGTISIDGGVTIRTARELVRRGANRLAAGSAILSAENPPRAYRELLSTVNA